MVTRARRPRRTGPLQGEGKCGLRADGREQSGAELLEEPRVASAQLQPHHELRLGGVDGGHLVKVKVRVRFRVRVGVRVRVRVRVKG